jgi:acyl-CoA reductase-like NAD-dependent aldehyde dehydrogenase
MAETLVDGIRPLSSFTPVEQRAILALVKAADISAAQLDEIKEASREAARAAIEAALRARDARRALPTTRRASASPVH